mmetsp:Transcript_6809/g.41544  ORF Transcript_6809/g.41544 Transcript_6809/m.41544 type:complete len:324 (-) Transcript_6809:548-1519(-)
MLVVCDDQCMLLHTGWVHSLPMRNGRMDPCLLPPDRRQGRKTRTACRWHGMRHIRTALCSGVPAWDGRASLRVKRKATAWLLVIHSYTSKMRSMGRRHMGHGCPRLTRLVAQYRQQQRCRLFPWTNPASLGRDQHTTHMIPSLDAVPSSWFHASGADGIACSSTSTNSSSPCLSFPGATSDALEALDAPSYLPIASNSACICMATASSVRGRSMVARHACKKASRSCCPPPFAPRNTKVWVCGLLAVGTRNCTVWFLPRVRWAWSNTCLCFVDVLWSRLKQYSCKEARPETSLPGHGVRRNSTHHRGDHLFPHHALDSSSNHP